VDSQNSRLSLHLYARSIDSFLGLPFNIASYALLLTVLAERTMLSPWNLIISFGDLHIYKDNFDQVKEQLSRTPGKLPILTTNGWLPKTPLNCLTPENFTLIGYNPQPAIKAPIAV
jgi:thymidylate synthase